MKRALLVVALCACKSARREEPPGHHGHAESSDPAPPEPLPAPALAPACVPDTGVELVYLVTHDRELWAFDPAKLDGQEYPFRRVGRLECDINNTPFSMGVDRHGVAWVDYQDGSLYRVSILDAHCERVRHAEHMPKTFGMGFTMAGDRERLFIAPEDGDIRLATLDTDADPVAYWPFPPRDVETSRNPELCGTADGKLWGYYPEEDGGFVQEVDVLGGAPTGDRMPISSDALGHVGAWAFAQWGGTFYVFIAPSGAVNTSLLYAVNRKDGAHRFVRRVPFRVVGAGVSTCAPMLEKAG